jgi:hypothetical protein
VPFLLILSVAIGAFSQSFQHLGAFATFGESLFGTFTLMLGEFYLDDDRFTTPEQLVFFSLYAVFALVIMLNLLIAIISDSFEKMKEREMAQFLRERAGTIAEYQQLIEMVPFLRCWITTNTAWVHVLKPADSSAADQQASEWNGRLRRMMDKMDGIDKNIDDNSRKVERKVMEGMEQKMKGVEQKMEGMQQKMEGMEQKMEQKMEGMEQRMMARMEELLGKAAAQKQ